MDIVTIKKVIEAALRACTPDNSTIFRYSISHSTISQPSITIFYNAEKVSGKSFPKDDPAISIALGCVLFNIKACCKSLSLTATVDIAPSESNPNQLALISLSTAMSEQPTTAPIDAIDKRHTDRGAYHKNLSTNDKEDIKRIVFGCAPHHTVLFKGSDKNKIIKLIQKASEIRFQVKEIHALLTHSLRFDNSQPDGLHIDTLALPPGGQYFLKYISNWKNLSFINKIGAYKFLALQETALLNNSPCLLLLKGGETKDDFIKSGEDLCNVWTMLNNAGYSVHPYYVIPDILHRLNNGTLPNKHVDQAKSLIHDGGNLVKEDGNLIYMILRIGKTKKVPVRSTRPTLDSLVSVEHSSPV